MITQEVRKPIKSYEAFITEGLLARGLKDSSQWKLGDLASELLTTYGQDTLGQFAADIGIEKKTLANYRTIAMSFKPEIRSKYPLSFSHFAAVCGNPKADMFLALALENKWSVEHLRHEISQTHIMPPDLKEDMPQVFKCRQCRKWRLKELSAFDICRGHYNLRNGQVFYD